MDSRERWFYKGNYIISGLVIALGLFASIYAITQYSYMDKYSLGPAFYPFWVGLLLVLAGIIMVVQNRKGHYQENKKKVPSKEAVRDIGLFVGLTTALILVVKFLGMVISLIAFLIILNLFVSRNSWKKSIAMAVITTAAIYVVFHMVFHINFPVGILGI